MKIPLELKKKYLQRRIHDMDCLVACLDKDDFSLAHRIGHQMKGNAQTFEFPQIAPFAIKLEQAAKEMDKAGVILYTQQIKAVLCAAQIFC
jgi:HPt (histidine-containing phosphotransfer) domain-containing protein